jgi:hypothetical protein
LEGRKGGREERRLLELMEEEYSRCSTEGMAVKDVRGIVAILEPGEGESGGVIGKNACFSRGGRGGKPEGARGEGDDREVWGRCRRA